MAPPGSLFAQNSYDRDAPEYERVETGEQSSAHSHRRMVSATTVGSDDDGEVYDPSENDRAVLEEEDEREKLLSRSIFSSLGRANGNPVRIGKKVKGARRKAGDVAAMMGGKRLGMEDVDEESESDSDDEVDKLLVGEKELIDKKPRKPTLRRIILLTASALSFLLLLIASSLYLSPLHSTPILVSNGTTSYAPTTLLISVDGLRADFLTPELTPHLYNLSQRGLSPPYMHPSFPSVTFPNHFTLATGLLPRSHGIVGNTFFSPTIGDSFHYTTPARSMQAQWWTQNPSTLPIWQAVEQAGGRSAVHMWPGSEVPGLGASYIDKFAGKEPLPKKISTILNYLDLPLSQRPSFLAAYVPDVDAAGHKFGPNTTETKAVLLAVDTALATLTAEIAARNLTDIVNLILVSDHGMATTSKTRLIPFASLINPRLIEHTEGWPLFGLRPFPDQNLTEIYETILAKHKIDSPWDVYTHATFPERFNFTDGPDTNPRIAPVWIVPHVGWAIVTEKEEAELKKTGGEYAPAGMHGYDNTDPLMRAMFLAVGPAFDGLRAGGRNLRPFQNTEVYTIVAETLGVKVGRGDASIGSIEELLVKVEAEDKEDSDSDSDSDSDDEEEKEKPSKEEKPSKASKPASSTSAPTSTQAPTRPVVSTGTPTPTDRPTVGVDEPVPETPDTRTWWQLLKDKADKAGDRLQTWWDDVWVKDGGGGGKGEDKPE